MSDEILQKLDELKSDIIEHVTKQAFLHMDLSRTGRALVQMIAEAEANGYKKLTIELDTDTEMEIVGTVRLGDMTPIECEYGLDELAPWFEQMLQQVEDTIAERQPKRKRKATDVLRGE